MKSILRYQTRNSRPTVNQREKSFLTKCVQQKYLLILAAPAFFLVLVFNYLPMYGVVVAFQDFSVVRGIFGSAWVGLKWFESFFRNPLAFRIIRNTFLLGFTNFAFSFPAPIILALLLNELIYSRLFKRTIQTLSYFPSFISTVIIVGILKELTSLHGVINALITNIGGNPIFFFGRPDWFRPLYIASGIWQGVGVGTIIYLAALSNINPELYESAVIDGAGRFKRVLHITIPSLASTIIILFILNVGNMVSADTQKVLLMYNPQTYQTADILGTYVFREGILGGRFSFSAAVGLLANVVAFFFVYSTNMLSRKFSDTSLW